MSGGYKLHQGGPMCARGPSTMGRVLGCKSLGGMETEGERDREIEKEREWEGGVAVELGGSQWETERIMHGTGGCGFMSRTWPTFLGCHSDRWILLVGHSKEA